MLRSAAIVVLLALWSEASFAADLLLRWRAVPDTSGYRLYIGTQSRLYTQQQDLGPLTADTIEGIVHFLENGFQPGSYFFALTAYNGTGESDYSNEKAVPFDGGAAPVASAGPDQVGVVGQTIVLGAAGGSARYV